MNVDQNQITLLKEFINLLKANPAVLHMPTLSFFKEYLESLGAKIPPAATSPRTSESKSPRTSESKSEPEPKKETAAPEPEPEPEPEESSESDLDCQLKTQRSNQGHRCSFQVRMTMSSESLGTWDITVKGRHVPAFQYWEPPNKNQGRNTLKNEEMGKRFLEAAQISRKEVESLRMSLPEEERPNKRHLKTFLDRHLKKRKIKHEETDSDGSKSDEDYKEQSDEIVQK